MRQTAILPFTLDRIQHCLARLGNPHHRLNAIHVAGTNGKGSVCALLDSALRAAGYSTGLTISPHLITEHERIQLNGQPIDPNTWHDASQHITKADPDKTLSYFERIIAMAFWVFAHQNVDWAIIETGVGGRLDATNVLPQPAITVITSIGLDHQAWLGDTLEQIAVEKAGIIKPGVPLVVGAGVQGNALRVITQQAEQQNAPWQHVKPDRLVPVDQPPGYILGRWQDGDRVWHSPLLGHYQQHNLATALTTLQHLQTTGHRVGSPDDWSMGFMLVNWPGRFQLLSTQRWIVDGSHNADGMATLINTLNTWRPASRPMALILTLKANRDPAMLHPLVAALPWTLIWVTNGPDESYHPLDCLAKALTTACVVQPVASLPETVTVANQWIADNPDGWVLATGSLYTAGDVLQNLTSSGK